MSNSKINRELYTEKDVERSGRGIFQGTSTLQVQQVYFPPKWWLYTYGVTGYKSRMSSLLRPATSFAIAEFFWTD
jgi:hypothetical protein